MSSEPDASAAPSAAGPPAGGGGPWNLLIPLVFTGVLLGASVLGSVGSRWSMRDLAVVGLLDFLLFFALHSASRWLRAKHLLLGVLPSLLLGYVIAFTMQVDGELILGRKQMLVAGLCAVMVHQVLLLVFAPGPRRGEAAGRYLMGAGLALLGFLALGMFAFRTLPSVRWHLLWHQHAVGLQFYSFLCNSIDQEQAALQAAHGKLVDAADVVGAVEIPAIDARVAETTGAGDVVFVLVDTWRADSLGVNGGAEDLMPRLNALAGDGIALTNLHANASWTRASCATIFTGLLPEEVGATSFADTLPEAWTTLPEVLQGAGYRTAAFVTNWIQVGQKTGFAQGFEHFRELRSFEEVAQRLEAGNEHIRELYARAEEVNSEVFQWLDGENRNEAGGRPLFLYLHYLDPHSPYLAGVEENVPAENQARKRSGYRQEVRYTDEHLGALIDGVRQRLGPDVTFVITSDHGEEFWEHGVWGHGHSLYREQIWVPGLILRGPGAGDGRRSVNVVNDPLESRDLFDLTVALASDPAMDVAAWAADRARTERYASQYLTQALDAPLPELRKTVMRRLDRGSETMIWSAYGPTEEVFDREVDPLETDNRIGDDLNRDRILRTAMDGILRFWVRTARVHRTPEELRMLNNLGYGQASAATTVPKGAE